MPCTRTTPCALLVCNPCPRVCGHLPSCMGLHASWAHLECQVQVGVLVDIDVADTVSMPQHGNASAALDVCHQGIAAPWDHQIDDVIQRQQAINLLSCLSWWGCGRCVCGIHRSVWRRIGSWMRRLSYTQSGTGHRDRRLIHLSDGTWARHTTGPE